MLSRVADNLYWLSRYLERAELTARVLEVNLTQMLDQTPEAAEQRWQRVYDGLMIDDPGTPNEATATKLLTVDKAYAASIRSCVSAARHNGSQIRTLLSMEVWQQLNELHHKASRTRLSTIEAQPTAFLLDTVCNRIHLIRGLIQTTILHGEQWHYLELGRTMERALLTTTLLRTAFKADYDKHAMMDWVALLRSCLSYHPYITTYTAVIKPKLVAEFLLLNPDSPRSVRYAADHIAAATRFFAQATNIPSEAERIAGKLQALLSYSTIDDLMTAGIPDVCDQVRSHCETIDAHIYESYINLQPV